VNRIFEGTNEINRLLIPGMLARRAVSDIAIILRQRRCRRNCSIAGLLPTTTPAAEERRAVESFKKASLMVLGLGCRLIATTRRAEVLMHLADMLIDTYAAESAASGVGLISNGLPERSAGRRHARPGERRRHANRGCSTRRRWPPCSRRHAADDGVGYAGSSVRCPSMAALRRRLADEAVARGGYIFSLRSSFPGAEVVRARGTGSLGCRQAV
jgi:hypothetical protein